MVTAILCYQIIVTLLFQVILWNLLRSFSPHLIRPLRAFKTWMENFRLLPKLTWEMKWAKQLQTLHQNVCLKAISLQNLIYLHPSAPGSSLKMPPGPALHPNTQVGMSSYIQVF